ncbi:bifunctional hydroxymethylpyrimidine kinase/phosphomethylpyrimidine kinase [Rossellomorea vietnamensis]|uniref:Hydroxymethylpyrimidine/phosphomethylpyrimidine kinase n=1 Tax=Rossellomorea vietnamensis TaxID=218284 RepID=A0A0P6W4Y3_9BACI|nr:bifunctional hydroxymethylpyrimidine kinase/phosphomethylpyrimidine kinase [Rossellomorea vietnamensis]KPL60030.1 phosphomethylpyrimidine kinase [Rossellomorea vietnamensis]
MVNKVLTIAGSDSGGGAGIQADLKTFHQCHVYGMSAITAVTAQNTKGVQGIFPLTASIVLEQLTSVAEDLPPQAVKTGMLVNDEIIASVADFASSSGWENLIVDPVMIAKGGASLLEDKSIDTLINCLIPIAYVITPNIPEAEILTGREILNVDDCRRAAEDLYKMGAKHVVIKGGHQPDTLYATDALYDGKEFYEFTSPRVSTPHTHGTGCTFSAVLTAELAKGHTVYDSVRTAKEFITAAITHSLGIGSGHGPTNHWAYHEGVKV